MALTRAERDRFVAATPDDIEYGEGACLETPRKVFELLNQRFKFCIDLTANETNHLLPYWFGPGGVEADALTAEWMPHQDLGLNPAGFSNPPYGPFIPKILAKAIQERDKGFTSVFLLPMRAGGWFQNLVIPQYSELWYCASRLTFPYLGAPRLNKRTGKPDGALFDSIIVVYSPYEWSKWGLFPPPQRPNVWDPKTGELRY